MFTLWWPGEISLSVKGEDLMLFRGAKGWTTRLKINDTNTHTHQCLGNMLGLQSQKHVFASNVRGRKNVKTSKVPVRTKHARTHVKVPLKAKGNSTQHTGSLGGGSSPTSSHPAPDSPAHRPALTSGEVAAGSKAAAVPDTVF